MRHYITLPSGRAVGLAQYAQAWKHIAKLPPHTSIYGWSEWGADSAIRVLGAMRHGMHDRINRHDRTMHHEPVSEKRLARKIRDAAKRGAIVYECRNCYAKLDFLRVNPNNRESRFCSHECRRSYY